MSWVQIPQCTIDGIIHHFDDGMNTCCIAKKYHVTEGYVKKIIRNSGRSVHYRHKNTKITNK